MKKLISALLILSMAAALTGCTSGSNSGSSGESQSESQSSSSADESAPSDSGAMTSEGGDANSDTESENSDANIGAEGEGTGAASGAEEDFVEYTPDPDGRAAKLAEAVFNAVEYPGMMEVNRSDYAEGFFGLDLSICEDFYVSNAMISAQLAEVIIAKPKAGSEDALKEIMDKHFDYIKNDPNATFYPDQEISAAGAVSGVTDDGYYYILVHENGDAAAEALLAVE